MPHRGAELSFFQGIHSCKNWYKNYLHFHKTYEHQILQADTSKEADLNETN